MAKYTMGGVNMENKISPKLKRLIDLYNFNEDGFILLLKVYQNYNGWTFKEANDYMVHLFKIGLFDNEIFKSNKTKGGEK